MSYKLKKAMNSKGIKLQTWAKAKNLRKEDIPILYDISRGKIQGKRGRAKELKEILEKDGFKIA